MGELNKEIDKFENQVRPNSVFCRLSLGDSVIPWNEFNSASRYPFAFILFLDNLIDEIDNILKKFDIVNKGTKDFKTRLQDRYFQECENAVELQQAKAILGDLMELLVAEYLSNNGEGIKNLGAWDDSCPADIYSVRGTAQYYTEVKYIGEIPELYNLNRNIIRTGKNVGAGSIGSLDEIYNYINLRVADAVFQLENKKIDVKKRRVFMVIEDSLLIQKIIPHLKKAEDWCILPDALLNRLNLSKQKKSGYKSYSVAEFHNKAGKLIISLLDKRYYELLIKYEK